MSRATKPERILEHLVADARRIPEPKVDFQQVQSRVRSAWVAERHARARFDLRWRWLGAAAVAVSFFVGGWYGHERHQQSESQVNANLSAEPTVDGRALLLDQELEAGREPLTVNHPGVARWTLAPGGKAKLAARGQFLTVQLDVGTIEADVVHSAQAESFAIEAGALRVAVHGTSFSVAKTDDSLVVNVTAGTVVVGASGTPGQTEGTILHAPARQRFSATVAPMVQPAASSAEPAARPLRAKAQTASSAPAVSVEPVLPAPAASAGVTVEDHPSTLEIETALDTVRAAAARCFAESKGSDPSRDSHVSVRVETHLTITLSPTGALADLVFSPPIPSAMVECTRREVAGFSISSSKLGAAASRLIMLTK